LKDLVISGGGTGGHVFPGLAVLRVLEQKIGAEKLSVAWYGSTKGMERRILEDEGVPFRGVPAGKLRRYFSINNLVDTIKVLAGFFVALFLLTKDRPKVVFSKGGYVTVPVVYAAALLRIPVVTHESDTDPGLATRLNARVARKILLSYEATRASFSGAPDKRLIVTGNPVRPAVLHGDGPRFRRLFGVPPGRPLIVVLGGSLGARQFNELFDPILDRLAQEATICHQRGSRPPLRPDGPGYFSRPLFGSEYGDLLAAATVVVARAGAGTVSELAATGCPAILIPLSAGGSRGDQLRNAAVLAEAQAAVVLDPESVTPEGLESAITSLLRDPGRRAELKERILALARPEAADRAAEELMEYLV
jgi:UDP-N-acetylglucosamine--N-acetylmuramyl-(pentapeptide) pyrophosphoryl-undecaprenol N-acetylglucosamine transferase